MAFKTDILTVEQINNEVASSNILFSIDGSEKARITSDGSVLIGTTSATANTKLDILMPNGASTNGIICRNSDGQIALYNGTSITNRFAPIFRGYSAGADKSTYLVSDIQAGNDSGSTESLIIRAQIGNAPVATRPVLGIYNYTTKIMTFAANGDVNVNTNTGSSGFYVSRLGTTNEALKITCDDGSVNMYSIQDEAGGSGSFSFYTGESLKMRITSTGNVKIGGIGERATTIGTNHIDIFNGIAPVGSLANGISIYSSSGECYIMDAAGNATLQSPHNEDGDWIFYSKNTRTGKVLTIEMEKFMKFLNKKFNLDFVKEYQENL
ncbi:MAG: hypothetical protein WC942_11015 [Clostridia bacterium]|jgi:hypothetical protein